MAVIDGCCILQLVSTRDLTCQEAPLNFAFAVENLCG